MKEFFILHQHLLSYVILTMAALAIGSLLNVIIYRLPIMIKAAWTAQCCELLQQKTTKNNKPINLFLPLSFCPHCKNSIPFWHNIPLLSYCLLKGHSHCCKQRISLQYPLVELTCAILSITAIWFFGFNIMGLSALIFIWIIICLSVIDLHHQLLPDSLTLGLLWLGLIINTTATFIPLPTAVLSAAGAYISLWLFHLAYYALTKKHGMGHGDFKLFAALGAWYGFEKLPIILLISATTGSVIGLIYLKITKKSKNTPIPFGPFLCMAGLIVLLQYAFIPTALASQHHPMDFLQSIQGSKDEGKQIVAHYCASCHANNPIISVGAPRIGNQQDWAARLKKGRSALFKNTSLGLNAMPARGGCFECSDKQLTLAILELLPKQERDKF